MRFVIKAIGLLAFALPCGLRAQEPATGPACRANLDGDRLTTAIEFPDGYTVEAPWQLNVNRSASLEDGRTGVVASARLDRIVEVDPATGERIVTPFPEPIETTFEGLTEEEMVYRAAQIWCLTVMKAKEQGARGTGQPAQHRKPTRTIGP